MLVLGGGFPISLMTFFFVWVCPAISLLNLIWNNHTSYCCMPLFLTLPCFNTHSQIFPDKIKIWWFLQYKQGTRHHTNRWVRCKKTKHVKESRTYRNGPCISSEMKFLSICPPCQRPFQILKRILKIELYTHLCSVCHFYVNLMYQHFEERIWCKPSYLRYYFLPHYP